MTEIQRYRIDDSTATLPMQAIKDASGGWVLYSDHNERIAQLTAAINISHVDKIKLTAERDAAMRDLDETTKMLKIESEAAREARAELSRLKAPVRFGEVLHYREDPNIHDDSTRIAHARATMVQNVIANRSNPPGEAK